MQRLQNERKQRLAEMEKIKNLDEKIQIELASLTTKIESMSGEMVEFEVGGGRVARALVSPTPPPPVRQWGGGSHDLSGQQPV